MTQPGIAPCPRCGALVHDASGPVHVYVPSSAGCWMTFGEVQADEMQRFGYPDAHRLVVDAYMAQHPGDGVDRRERQSVFVHLVGLCAVLEQDMPAERAARTLGPILRRREGCPRLTRSSGRGVLTVLHMVGARDLSDYELRAREWAQTVWQSWTDAHGVVREAIASATWR
jgi:hypothetical protein